jgi:hypothetical protein
MLAQSTHGCSARAVQEAVWLKPWQATQIRTAGPPSAIWCVSFEFSTHSSLPGERHQHHQAFQAACQSAPQMSLSAGQQQRCGTVR